MFFTETYNAHSTQVILKNSVDPDGVGDTFL
jgi:hypothetical protein